MIRRRLASLLVLAPLAGCEGIQSATGGDGLHAAQFNGLFTLFMVVTGAAYLLVLLFLGAAVLKRRDAATPAGERQEKQLTGALVGWTGFILVGLTVLTVGSYLVDRSYARAAVAPPRTLQIEITAKQWWWDVKYLDPTPSNTIRTANELHLPVGIPAHIRLKSGDVIHSFWVPNLAGKQDAIPGRQVDIVLEPSKPGQYRGQCAEFCGIQHAHMALDVIVEPIGSFEAWREAALQPAPPPATPLQQAGYNYVMNRECSACHAIAGTPASGQVAPDLTHVASRRSIAAGTFPMTRGHLYAWVADPQGAKPGNNMPYVGLQPNELHAVVAYLETLK